MEMVGVHRVKLLDHGLRIVNGTNSISCFVQLQASSVGCWRFERRSISRQAVRVEPSASKTKLFVEQPIIHLSVVKPIIHFGTLVYRCTRIAQFRASCGVICKWPVSVLIYRDSLGVHHGTDDVGG